MSLAFRASECIALGLDHSAMRSPGWPEAAPVHNKTLPTESHLRWTDGITEVLNGAFEELTMQIAHRTFIFLDVS